VDALGVSVVFSFRPFGNRSGNSQEVGERLQFDPSSGRAAAEFARRDVLPKSARRGGSRALFDDRKCVRRPSAASAFFAVRGLRRRRVCPGEPEADAESRLGFEPGHRTPPANCWGRPAIQAQREPNAARPVPPSSASAKNKALAFVARAVHETLVDRTKLRGRLNLRLPGL